MHFNVKVQIDIKYYKKNNDELDKEESIHIEKKLKEKKTLSSNNANSLLMLILEQIMQEHAEKDAVAEESKH